MCSLCESHEEHDIINLSDIMINKNVLLEENDKFKIIIDKFQNEVEKIKNILNSNVNYIEIYYEISREYINHYENKNKNYEILMSLNDIKSSNEIIMNKLNNIINKKNLNKKFNTFE